MCRKNSIARLRRDVAGAHRHGLDTARATGLRHIDRVFEEDHGIVVGKGDRAAAAAHCRFGDRLGRGAILARGRAHALWRCPSSGRTCRSSCSPRCRTKGPACREESGSAASSRSDRCKSRRSVRRWSARSDRSRARARSKPPLAFMQFAIARADVALDAAILQPVPVAAGHALDDRLIHDQAKPSFRAVLYSISGKRTAARQRWNRIRSAQSVRPPAAAGLFYAGDPRRLQTSVAELIGAVEASTGVPPKALIAPHAGYVYSGAVAAQAFARLRAGAHAIKRVVLIGPAHFVPLRGIAAPTVDAFETPLGRVPLDREALSAIAVYLVVEADAPHAPEHSLEVELPFLQALLPSFALLPLVIGDATAHRRRGGAAAALGRAGNGDRGQLRSFPLSRLRHSTAPRCRNCRRHRARRLAKPRPRPSLRLSCGGWPHRRDEPTTPRAAAARAVQFGRHGREAARAWSATAPG